MRAGSRATALVFLPGERQIQEALELLRREAPAGRELLPLYSRLSTAEQERIFAPHAAQRIILATNVAETSLTIPGVRFVIDSGLARISRYSPRAKLQRLPIEPVSRASADQRKGRCGREGEGICIRLYSETDFAERPEYTEPEIHRTNLASLILQMAALGLGAPEEFPFIDAPDGRLLNDGYRLLAELSAVDGERRITRLGRRMARLPVDPRLARVLIEAARLGCLPECLVITAFLSIQDPRERPAGRLEAADERHASFADPRSDFVTVLNLWRALGEQSAAGSRALRRWCRDNFLSWPRVQGMAGPARATDRDRPLGHARTAAAAASHSVLHRALLAGLSRRYRRARRGSHVSRRAGHPLRHCAGDAARASRSALDHGREPGRDTSRVRAHGGADPAVVDRGRGGASGPTQLRRRGMVRRARHGARPRNRLAVRARAALRTHGRLCPDRSRDRAADLRRGGAGARPRWTARRLPRTQCRDRLPRSRASRPGCAGATCWSARRRSRSSTSSASRRR